MRLIAVLACVVCGLAIGDVAQLAVLPLLVSAAVALAGACLSWRQPAWRTLALLVCGLALGAARAASVWTAAEHAASQTRLDHYANRQVRLQAVLVAPATVSATGVMHLVVGLTAIGPAGTDPLPLRAASVLGAADSSVGLSAASASAFLADMSPTAAPCSTAAEAAPSPEDAASAAPRGPSAPSNELERVAVVGDPATFGAASEGDCLTLEGRLAPPSDARGPPTLVFPRLLSVAPQPGAGPRVWLARLREHADGGIRAYLPEPQASLASGVLLGGQGRLDAGFRADLQRTGLTHVVAIDGYKQVVVVAAVGAVATRLLGARLAVLPTLAALAGYTLLTGAHASAVRAGLMVGLATLAAMTGRTADPLTSLLLALLTMASVEPRILLDLGLQLSLSATLGIILLWPRFRRRLRRVPRPLAEPLGLTLAVTIASLPVTLQAFAVVSLVSPAAHIVALPLVPAILLSGGLLAVASSLPLVASGAAVLAWLPTTVLVWIVRAFGSLPGAALSTGRLPPPAAAALGVGLLVWGVWNLPELANQRRELTRWRIIHAPVLAPFACIVACMGGVLWLNTVRPDGRVHLEPLALDRGQAVFVRGPTGRTALIVAGKAPATTLVDQVAGHLAVWEHSLDAVVTLDAQAQSAVGLTVERYPAMQRIDLPASSDTRVYAAATALDVSYAENRLSVVVAAPTSGPTTSAATPGSGD
jgi:ComEC/Rec2-related protein